MSESKPQMGLAQLFGRVTLLDLIIHHSLELQMSHTKGSGLKILVLRGIILGRVFGLIFKRQSKEKLCQEKYQKPKQPVRLAGMSISMERRMNYKTAPADFQIVALILRPPQKMPCAAADAFRLLLLPIRQSKEQLIMINALNVAHVPLKKKRSCTRYEIPYSFYY